MNNRFFLGRAVSMNRRGAKGEFLSVAGRSDAGRLQSLLAATKTTCQILTSMLGIWLSVTASPAQTIRRVPDDYATIQSAVNAANDGDVVLIGAGLYPESVGITNKNITLRGADESRSAIIDGQGAAAAIHLYGGSSNTIENGFFRNYLGVFHWIV